jgi:leucyl-tRNA synthetase
LERKKMAEYKFQEIESKWQKYWKENQVFKTKIDNQKPKYYVLDMFPYPSGAGLHVGHPLGYIATDIVARFKRITGHNVFHPMGFDSFGLPAEQYAIKTGQHPAVTTENNIKRFKEQMSILGFSYDWSREVWTSDPKYYRWTQWIFLKLFNSFYDEEQDKARPIEELEIPSGLSEKERQEFVDDKRLAYQADISVNWCEELGTVLANEEVVGGVSERGGYPVVKKTMKQWMLRITAYADRLANDLEGLDWPESIILSQRNWIGKSIGADIIFPIKESSEHIQVFTTRPDTIYGVTYMVLAPEHPLVQQITTKEQKQAVEDYIDAASKKSDLERTELDKTKTGVFTGGFAINPITGEEIPVWISDYVLISYGTGAIMAVPGGDQRDFEFAEKFGLEIIEVINPKGETSEKLEEAYPGEGIMVNSGEYNGMTSQEFKKAIIDRMENEGVGRASVNYKLRDWVFTRQRYWGEPIPVIHTEDGRTIGVPESDLPVTLPKVESYTGTSSGESPLAKVEEWVNTTNPEDGSPAKRETNTMPQWAGSCWYYLRYFDNDNTEEFAKKENADYWSPVDLYVGGAEHAVLHLLYARFWHKVLFDLGYLSTKEPFQKLINQGMIQGQSSFVYRIKGTNKYVSHNLRDEHKYDRLHVETTIVDNNILDIEAFKALRKENSDAEFILEDGNYICGSEIEKMSKSLLNVVTPDDIVTKYGADTFRLYEMFLGPLEQSKPWNTNGIDGVFKFLRKFLNLFYAKDGEWNVSEEGASPEELKITHKTLKKVKGDIERFSFNTGVSAFMICVNELTALNGKQAHKREVLEPLVIALSPFAPHLAEELWEQLGHEDTISKASYPEIIEEYIQEDSHEYPISVNGKLRTKMMFALDMPKEDIEKQVLANEIIQKWTEGKPPRKVIIVPKKIVNIVV